MKKVGAVVVFPAGMIEEDAIELLEVWAQQGRIESYAVDTFDPEHGSPVFYVP